MHFNNDFWLSSAFVFWTFAISVILTLGFTVVVFFGGIADLRFLLRALDESPTDDADAGHATGPRSPDDDASSHR